ncbi:MAG: hypothetical protein HOO99_07545 [Hyphomicrobiaceae bacterium]|nr:hypothetical protein [Hyphomicrobiaceae bacterium]
MALKSDLDVERLDRVLDDGLDDIPRIEVELAKPNTLDRRLLKRLAKLRANADARSHL